MSETPLHPFKGTPAQKRQLEEVIERHLNQPGGLMPVLQKPKKSMGICLLKSKQWLQMAYRFPFPKFMA